MTKKVIAILSVLKPVDDTRNFEKIATTIGNTNKYDINIIGFCSKNLSENRNITFYPVFNFKRLSLKRLVASLKIAQLLLKLKPELTIVTCTELLIVITLYKIIFGGKIIYDLQENYYRNIIYTNTYPSVIKYIIAYAVRLSEKCTAHFIDKFILAEKVYQDQLGFIDSKFEVIENKAVIPDNLIIPNKQNQESKTFLYSGTIAEHYGIFEAVTFIKKIHHFLPEAELRIVGHAPNKKVYIKLLHLTNAIHYIKILGNGDLVPHNQILNEIENADYCLMPYQINNSTAGRIPTKLYECLALEKPMIISPNQAWDSLICKNNAGIIFDFKSDVMPIKQIENSTYYGNNLKHNYLWKSQESNLLGMINDLI